MDTPRKGPRLSLTRCYVLSALHTLGGEGFSDEENRRVFGACSRLHGHDYRIEVTVSGPVDPRSGMLMNRDELDGLVSRHLTGRLEGTNLSDSFAFTTGEALAAEFYRLLAPLVPPGLELRQVMVHETRKNSFIVTSGFQDGE